MSTSYYEYRVRCLTDNRDETWILSENDAKPTTCPVNSTHEIDDMQTTIVRTIDENKVQIQEETTPTGGHFAAITLRLLAKPNSTTFEHVYWPFPISALGVDFITADNQKGDCLSIAIGKGFITGAIMTPVIPASSWTLQNYTKGSTVTFSHHFYGERVYTCIQNTVNFENPTNKSFWMSGFELDVTQTVLKYGAIGFYIKLFDGINENDLGRILSFNEEHSKIWVEKNPTNIFSPLSPTYVKQTVYMIKDYLIYGSSSQHNIGQSKIGGSYIPADVVITAEYLNHSDEEKLFVGRLEFLY